MDGWIDRWMDGWTDGWMDGDINIMCIPLHINNKFVPDQSRSTQVN